MKKITSKGQIERLYQFTRQHYVEYYELQTELVDHLANAIELRWEENPEEDFEIALQKEFGKFGIFGFSDIVDERKKAMRKRYYNLIKEQLVTFFRDTIPKSV